MCRLVCLLPQLQRDLSALQQACLWKDGAILASCQLLASVCRLACLLSQAAEPETCPVAEDCQMAKAVGQSSCSCLSPTSSPGSLAAIPIALASLL